MTRQEQSVGSAALRELTHRNQSLFPPGSSHPQWRGKFSTSELLIFNGSLTREDRCTLPFPAQPGRQYDGEWLCQGQEPTCMVWAIANAARVSGIALERLPLEEMIAHAKDGTKTDGIGIFAEDAVLRIDALANGVHLRKIRSEDQLLSTNSRILRYWADEVGIEQPDLGYEQEYEFLDHNARAIIEGINTHGALVIETETNALYGAGHYTAMHGLCLAGYRVTQDRHMDVQVINSARGTAWIGIEHLSRALLPRPTLFFTQSNNLSVIQPLGWGRR